MSRSASMPVRSARGQQKLSSEHGLVVCRAMLRSTVRTSLACRTWRRGSPNTLCRAPPRNACAEKHSSCIAASSQSAFPGHSLTVHPLFQCQRLTAGSRRPSPRERQHQFLAPAPDPSPVLAPLSQASPRVRRRASGPLACFLSVPSPLDPCWLP